MGPYALTPTGTPGFVQNSMFCVCCLRTLSRTFVPHMRTSQPFLVTKQGHGGYVHPGHSEAVSIHNSGTPHALVSPGHGRKRCHGGGPLRTGAGTGSSDGKHTLRNEFQKVNHHLSPSALFRK